MNDAKTPGAGADWTQLLTDPELARHLGVLLQTYREAPPEKRDAALLAAMRRIKSGAALETASTPVRALHQEEPPAQEKSDSQPVPAAAESLPPFEPDIFTPSSSRDRRRYPRLKCFVAVELRVGDSATPIWGNLANTGMGGCFVETASPVPSGANVEIGLWLASGKIWIKGIILTGVVTKSTPSFGVRVKFADLDSSARETLRHFLKFVESTAKGSHSEQAYLTELKR